MGLLDQVLGMGGGQQQQGGGNSPIMGLLGGLLGGGQGGGGGSSGGGQGLGGLAGGLPALLQRFEGAGLGNVAQSWVGSGPNQPVSPDQVHSAFGDQQIASMSQQSGIPQQDLLSQLAQHLPHMVDQMTPNGRVPAQAETSTMNV